MEVYYVAHCPSCSFSRRVKESDPGSCIECGTPLPKRMRECRSIHERDIDLRRPTH